MADPFEIARRVVGPAADLIPRMRTWQEVFEQLAELERHVWTSRASVEELLSSGGLTSDDLARFNELRDQLFAVQQRAYRYLGVILPSAVFAQIPRPEGVPAVMVSGTRIQPRRGTRVSGLGVAPLLIWAAIVLGIAAALLAVAVITLSVGDYIAEVIIARANADMYNDLVAARLAAFRECMAAGGEIEQCKAVAFGIAPPPGDVLPRRQKNTALVVLLSITGTVAAALGIRYAWKRMETKAS